MNDLKIPTTGRIPQLLRAFLRSILLTCWATLFPAVTSARMPGPTDGALLEQSCISSACPLKFIWTQHTVGSQRPCKPGLWQEATWTDTKGIMKEHLEQFNKQLGIQAPFTGIVRRLAATQWKYRNGGP